MQSASEGEAFLYSERTPYDSDEPEGIVPYCKWVATKYGYAEYYFVRFKDRVSGLYKELFPYLMGRRLPLVIADEAHHWRRKTQGCLSFCKFIAPFTHRLLMLTATPFQLHRDELSGIFSVGECMEKTIGKDRVEELKRRLNEVLKAMGNSEDVGRKFSLLWGRLADDLRTMDTEANLAGLSATEERTKFERQVEEYWRNLKADGSGNSEVVLSNIPGRVRPFFDAAIKLKHANQQLGAVMRKLVVRHRREIAHRRYRVGHEYPPRSAESERPDQHQLHAARGSQLPSETELAQFLLMKVVASATRGKRKTALGMDVTGAYSTLWHSKEGERALKAASQNESTKYFPILAKLTGGRREPNKMDAVHPSVRLAVKPQLSDGKEIEKTLDILFPVTNRRCASPVDFRGN